MAKELNSMVNIAEKESTISALVNRYADGAEENNCREYIPSFEPEIGITYNVERCIPQLYRLRNGRVFQGADIIIYGKELPKGLEKPVVPVGKENEVAEFASKDLVPIYVLRTGARFGVSFVLIVDGRKRISVARLFGRNCINRFEGKEIEEPAFGWFAGKTFTVKFAERAEFNRNDGTMYTAMIYAINWEI
jgi:hypothetical protein